MGISLAPSTTTGAAPTSPLPTEHPSAPSTTGTPQNRLQLATNAFDTFAKSTAPQYTADLRQATQQAAGNGQEGSGQLRTTYGNLANQRALALDTEKQNLINTATTGTIADQQAAQAQAVAQQNANTSQTSVTGNLALGKQNADTASAAQQSQAALGQGQLGLATTAQAQSNALGQGQLALATTAQQTNANQTQQQIDLAKLSQADQTALAKAGLTGVMQDGTTTLQAKQDAIQNALNQGQLTNAQAQTAIAALSQQSTATNQAGQLALQKQQLTQAGAEFGLTQAQNLKLAQLADQTQNRQIDVSTAQGQNALLLQLASIIGGPSGSLDPAFVTTIMNALGIGGGGSYSGTGNTGNSGGGSGGTGTGGTGTGSAGGGGAAFSLAPGRDPNANFFAQNAATTAANQAERQQMIGQTEQDAAQQQALTQAINQFQQQYGPGIQQPGSPGYAVPDPRFTDGNGKMWSQAERDQAVYARS